MLHLILIIPLFIGLPGCTGEGAGGSASNPKLAHAHDADDDPIIAMTPTASGVTAHVTWDPPSGIDVAGYDIHYGQHASQAPSAEESGSEEVISEEPTACSRGESQAVDGPSATITNLEPNTEYFFAIRAFNQNESESLCSNEIVAVTPSAES